MAFHLAFENLTYSEMLSFINEHDTPPFSQYSSPVFQPLISSDGPDEIYNPDSQLNTYNDNFTCDNFDLGNEDLKKISTSTSPDSCLTLASINIRSVSKKLEMFQMDIHKLKFDILGQSETRLSSDIEILHHVRSLELFASNRNTLGGGVLLYVRDMFNANELVNFSVVFGHLEFLFVSLSFGEINSALGHVHRPLNSNNDDFMSEI